MNYIRTKLIVEKEKRSYLFAAVCSAAAAMAMFYKLFEHNLYLKILDYTWFAIILGWLVIGNAIHGYFAFKSFVLIRDVINLDDVKSIKKTYYRSFLVNFLTPYAGLIILFISIKEFMIAAIAMGLMLLMVIFCYFFDLRPSMRLK